jgi:hypothetical protein
MSEDGLLHWTFCDGVYESCQAGGGGGKELEEDCCKGEGVLDEQDEASERLSKAEDGPVPCRIMTTIEKVR